MTLKATTSLPDARAFLGDAPVMAKRRVTEAGGASDTKQLRVAIVHYWLVSMRGGEKVVEELCRMFPQADIFTLVCNRDRISDFLKTRNIRTSFLQKIPGAQRHYTKMLPLMPFALEQFDLQEYDLVLSSESGPPRASSRAPTRCMSATATRRCATSGISSMSTVMACPGWVAP